MSEAATSFGMHFGTFRLTTEGPDEPVAALGRARSARLAARTPKLASGKRAPLRLSIINLWPSCRMISVLWNR